MNIADLRAKIRDIRDFPTEGILFKDITTLLKDGPAFHYVIDVLAGRYQKERVDVVVAVESRGFIFGGALAHELSAGFVPVRKLGKLPGKTIEVEYELEYGRDALAIHEDAVKPGQRVLAVDDLLATGGTMAATLRLIEQLGGHIVGVALLILSIFAQPIEPRVSAFDQALREDGPPPRAAECTPQADGSVRCGTGAGSVAVTVRNPCPPGTAHYEPPSLPGRRARN